MLFFCKWRVNSESQVATEEQKDKKLQTLELGSCLYLYIYYLDGPKIQLADNMFLMKEGELVKTGKTYI